MTKIVTESDVRYVRESYKDIRHEIMLASANNCKFIELHVKTFKDNESDITVYLNFEKLVEISPM